MTSKILLITDQHFGVRNDNQYYIDKYRTFYTETVLPFIDKHRIKTIINLGDTFDRRKYVNFFSLDAAKEMWFDPLLKRGVKQYMMVGNHDIYYKNTLRVNSPELLLLSTRTLQLSLSQLNYLLTGVIFFLYLGYVTKTERDPMILSLLVMRASVLGILSLTVLRLFQGIPWNTETIPLYSIGLI